MKMFMNQPQKKEKVMLSAGRQFLQKANKGLKNLDHHQRRDPTLRSPSIKGFLMQALFKLHISTFKVAKEISLMIDKL
jgi:hypothetical protein